MHMSGMINSLDAYRTMIGYADILLMVYLFVNGLFWASHLDAGLVKPGWRNRLTCFFCMVFPLVIWFLLTYPMMSTNGSP